VTKDDARNEVREYLERIAVCISERDKMPLAGMSDEQRDRYDGFGRNALMLSAAVQAFTAGIDVLPERDGWTDLPPLREIVAAAERVGHPRQLRTVKGWSRGEYRISAHLAYLLAVELGVDERRFFTVLARRRQAWLQKKRA
jgi:hypothetical protein